MVDWIRAIPKAEVHLHLEGCIGAQELIRLASAARVNLPRPVDQLFHFADLSDFLGFLSWACALVTTPEQLARLAYGVARREADSGVAYADLTVSPIHWEAWRGRIAEMIDAIDAGLGEAEEDGLPSVGLCVSVSRHQSAEEAESLVDSLLSIGHPRVAGLSIDGNEASAGRTGPRFSAAFHRARDGGLPRTVHAGESSGPEGIRDAIAYLAADRIDHGVRCIEDPSLVKELADRRIPLGICPLSNIRLGLFPDREHHPIDQLRRAGVPVSINTDDPVLFGSRLDEEYAATALVHRWDKAVIRQVARTSVEASFCDAETKRRLLSALDTTMTGPENNQGPSSPFPESSPGTRPPAKP